MANSSKALILSFDDGPEPEGALGDILKILKANGITAEFYVIGSEVIAAPKAAKQITDSGHKIENHSWSHQRLDLASQEQVRNELSKTQNAITKATGVVPTKVRPPYGNGGWPGKLDQELVTEAKRLSLTIKNWDIDTLDWQRPRGINATKRARILQEIRSAKKGILNVLMHVQKETASDLPVLIRDLVKEGHRFASP